MSAGQPTHPGFRRPGLSLCSGRNILFLVLLLLVGALYLQQAFQCFLIDDEGAYAYAAWRTGAGQVPYRDFMTPQMPLFLYWGGLLVRFFGRSYVPLRLGNMLATLGAAALLYDANRKAFGWRVAVCAAGLFLVEPNVFHSARHFRPEALMVFLELGGIYAFVLGEKRGRLGLTALAGALFGLATLAKLFGVLPLAGCSLYLLYAGWHERRPLQQTLRKGLALGAPAALLAGTVALLFARIAPYFYTAVFEHHTMQGAGMPLAERARKALVLYREYISDQWLMVALAALGAGLLLWKDRGLRTLFAWQVPTALGFMLLSRDLAQRHLIYLAPALATFAAVSLVGLLQLGPPAQLSKGSLRIAAGLLSLGLALFLALRAVHPWIGKDSADAAQAEQDSARLAALIRSLAPNDGVVMADYPGLNFLAGRRTTYWAAGMSGGAAKSGQITGAMLIGDIEREYAGVVIINTWGAAHQMAAMGDYAEFRRYVWTHFALVQRYQSAFDARELEIYARPANAAPVPGLAAQTPVGGAPPAREGAEIELRIQLAPELAITADRLWTVVQWQDGLGSWHDVEGWQGPCQRDGSGLPYRAWSVGPKDLGTGPFRWLVRDGRGGKELAASVPFHVPRAGGEKKLVMVALQ